MSVLTHRDAGCQPQMTKREASDLIFAYSLTSWAEFQKILDKADIKPCELEHQTAQAHYRAYKDLRFIEGVDFFIAQNWIEIRKKLSYTEKELQQYGYIEYCVDKFKANKFELLKAIRLIRNERKR